MPRTRVVNFTSPHLLCALLRIRPQSYEFSRMETNIDKSVIIHVYVHISNLETKTSLLDKLSCIVLTSIHVMLAINGAR